VPETSLKALLYRRTVEPYLWYLPGGFLNIDEMPEDNIRKGVCKNISVKNRIGMLHGMGLHKADPMPTFTFKYNIPA
jgi:ADP-ribose pyrophosphatase YjhB (NUDIX family)